ncbi:MAG: BTAD domain-containing putative transcriptional regulator, partial [Nocardioides sp.]|uniref:ATP-binding protein n=1 Tax=Nocardioides sp. TaxID=35761 RepID=UPI0039E6BEB6
MTRLRVADDVRWEDRPIAGERSRTLLRALVDGGPRGLSADALVDELWPDDRPADPPKALQVVVSRARTATAAEAIERTATGYRLTLDAGEVDLWAARPEGLRLASEGRYADALAHLELAPDDDEVVLARLRATAETQGVPAALEAFDAYRAELADRLGVDPAPAIQELHAELLRRDRPVRTGLGFDPDPLIGRAEDIAALQRLIRSRRIVSIVGAGGLGKTRLAHLVGRTAEQPAVYFVALASVTTGDGVAVEVADALGARGSLMANLVGAARTADVVERLVEAIGSVPSLLILDNCEQVVSAVADLVAVLIRRTPRLTVLTTTRAPLGLSAEHVYLLPELSTADGIALFRERASAARPGVVLADEQIAPIIERLDGLPLALELAAAKVRVMSVEEVERRLDNRFALLRGGSRDAPERHQTLLAVIDWSWNLLAEPDRAALRRLSVFRDGFALGGAEAVVGPDALERIEELVAQSLVVVDETAYGLRYRLLETVREFGRMQLVDAGDDADATRALAGWAAAVAGEAVAGLYGPEQIELMSRTRAEEGNLVDVLRRAIAQEDLAVAVAVFAGLSAFWTIEGSHLKVFNLVRPIGVLLAEHDVPAELVDAERATLESVSSYARMFAPELLPAAVARLTVLGPGDGPAWIRATVRVELAMTSAEAEADRHAVLEPLTRDPDPSVRIAACFWASQALENSGDLAGAREVAERAIAAADPTVGPWTEAMLHAHLAGVELQAGEWASAARRVHAALPVLTAIGAAEDAAQLRAVLALVALREGDLDRADLILDEMAGDELATSVFGGGLAVLCGRAEVLLARGLVAQGLTSYDAGVEDLRTRVMPTLQAAGLPPADGHEPWLLLPQAAALAAHARHG